MDQSFIEKMEQEMLKQKKTILVALAEQSDDMKGLIKTVESGDEADVASDQIDRTLLDENKKLKEEVKKLAELSRLSFTEEEVEKYQTSLNSIVEYCEKLNAIDVSSVKPSATTSDMVNVLREDEVKESLTRKEVLQNAKDKEYGCFYVTKVVE